MALVSKGLFFNVQIADLTGRKSNLRFDINTNHPDLGTVAAMAGANGQTTLAEAITRIAAVTKGSVVGYSFGEAFTEDTVEFGAGDNKDKLICTAAIDGQISKRGRFSIPAPADGVFVNNAAPGEDAEKADPADAALLAYARMFQATSLTQTGQGAFLISDGEQLIDDPVVKGRKH